MVTWKIEPVNKPLFLCQNLSAPGNHLCCFHMKSIKANGV